MLVTKEEIEKYKEHLIKEISTFLSRLSNLGINNISSAIKECPMCKNKFKDFLEKRNICVTCEREQKLNDLGI